MKEKKNKRHPRTQRNKTYLRQTGKTEMSNKYFTRQVKCNNSNCALELTRKLQIFYKYKVNPPFQLLNGSNLTAKSKSSTNCHIPITLPVQYNMTRKVTE